MPEKLEKYTIYPANFVLFSKEDVLLQRSFPIVDFHEIKSICWHCIILENLVESEHYETLRKLAHKSGKLNATAFSPFSSFEDNETLEGG